MSKTKSLAFLIVFVLPLIGFGCGSSGGGGDTPPGETMYTVGGTVSGLSGTLMLTNNGADDLTIAQDGAFTFPTAAADGTSYSVAVKTGPSNQNCSVANASGVVQGSNVTAVVVSCENKTWTHPASLDDHISVAGQDAFSPLVAMDKNGNAIIVWNQFDNNASYQIYKSEYRSGTWTNPSSLDDHISIAGQDALAAEVAMDDNGNTIIVWQQSDGTNNQVYKSEYRNGIWTHPTSTSDHISTAGQPAGSPQAAMDTNGNAIITWNQFDGACDRIYMSEYRNGVWNDTSSLADQITAAGQYASEPHVAMADGSAIITWMEWDGTNYQIYKSEYRNGTWTHPASTSDHINVTGPSVEYPLVVMSNNGDAIITWIQYDGSGTNYQVYKSEYRNGIWTNPASLDDHISVAGQPVQYPRVAMDSNGSAIITWAQSDGITNQIYKSEYRNGVWISPSSLDDHISVESASDNAYAPDAAMDDNGNAIITWKQYDGDYDSIFKSEYRNGSWTNPASLADHVNVTGSNADYPDAAMDDNGNALITWTQSDGITNQIYKSEYR